MNVGDKVLVEAEVTMVGDELVAVMIRGLQGVEHIRLLKDGVQPVPARVTKSKLAGGAPEPVA